MAAEPTRVGTTTLRQRYQRMLIAAAARAWLDEHPTDTITTDLGELDPDELRRALEHEHEIDEDGLHAHPTNDGTGDTILTWQHRITRRTLLDAPLTATTSTIAGAFTAALNERLRALHEHARTTITLADIRAAHDALQARAALVHHPEDRTADEATLGRLRDLGIDVIVHRAVPPGTAYLVDRAELDRRLKDTIRSGFDLSSPCPFDGRRFDHDHDIEQIGRQPFAGAASFEWRIDGEIVDGDTARRTLHHHGYTTDQDTTT